METEGLIILCKYILYVEFHKEPDQGVRRFRVLWYDEQGHVIGADLDLVREGLMAGWFDGCMGFVSSPERMNSVEFTDPFRIQQSSFAVQRGNPKGFNPADISNSIITYLDGAYTNEECLKRLNIGTPKQIIVAKGILEGRELMLNGTADALFSPRTAFRRLDVLDTKYRCDSKGTGVMIKKGSDLASWWNPAFKVFYESGRYTKHCATINEKYKVCKIAGEKCEILIQPFEECVRTYNGKFYPGRGLMAGWFDACVNFVSSVDRVNSLSFTNKIREAYSKFAVYKGNPKGFDPNNISESTIVHLNGAYANEQCMVRIGLGRPKRVIVAATIDEAKALMLNQTGDALFSQRSSFNELDVIPTDFHCDINGSSMMVKKGSTLPDWWNPAFDKYYKSGAYSTNCEGANKKYGGHYLFTIKF
ncbi:hypothetical protein FSP39_013459 [Pinctada imbricata]|uniref:Solute-binding protein family 3/N-terminal domain-containing protein n=1 Tax=Pinctada imbricata TaxID=66713 RepID=A0AA88YR48_PINIB|nr:hypothetical protein FSP39_013459 [Pinctada imbricata]